jgi:hypothetical protein
VTRSSTSVSKADPAVKKVLAAIKRADDYAWSGRKIDVVQVDPGFTYTLYNDTGEPKVFRVDLGGGTAARVPPPKYGGPSTQVDAPIGGEALVTRQVGSTGFVTIYVPELDASVLDVARDALAAGDKRQAASALKMLGPYAGIGGAIVASQDKTIARVSGGKRSRQLDREIDTFIRSRR